MTTAAPTQSLQVFDDLTTDLDEALEASIRRDGIKYPVLRADDGRMIDGHQRSRIAEKIRAEGGKIRVPEKTIKVRDDAHAQELAVALNAARRHLTVAQRKQAIRTLTEAGCSLRRIAEATGTSKSQVQRTQAALSQAGQLEAPEATTGADGKTRKRSSTARSAAKRTTAKTKGNGAKVTTPTGEVIPIRLVPAPAPEPEPEPEPDTRGGITPIEDAIELLCRAPALFSDLCGYLNGVASAIRDGSPEERAQFNAVETVAAIEDILNAAATPLASLDALLLTLVGAISPERVEELGLEIRADFEDGTA